MVLEDALRFSGYTIDTYQHPGVSIPVDDGALVVPPMILSRLTWHREEPAPLGSAFYLDTLPAFDPAYAPVQLSLILDRYRRRRLGYDTPDDFALAVRRWGNTHLGATSTIARRYRSLAVQLPLDTVDITRTVDAETTSTGTSETTGEDTITSEDTSSANTKNRTAQSDYPQGQLAGNLDYATAAADTIGDTDTTGEGTTNANRTATTDTEGTDARTETHRETGRTGTVMELLEAQRAAFLNVDAELLEALEPLFLGVFDRSETTWNTPTGYGFGW